MYSTSGMNVLGFGPAHGSHNFEDEVESLYLSDMLSQDDLQQMPAHQGVAEVDQLPPSDSFDMYDSLELVTGKPEDITGQSPAWKMEDDKRDVLQQLDNKWDSFMDMDICPDSISHQIKSEEDADVGGGGTQDLIREMEEFLSQYEPLDAPAIIEVPAAEELTEDQEVSDLAKELLSLEQQNTLGNMDADPCLLNDEDTRIAEDMLDALLGQMGAGQTYEHQPQGTDVLQIAVESENLHDSGFIDDVVTVSNLSHHQTADHGSIIVVVTPSDVTSASQDDDDSDWTPDVPKKTINKKPGRKLTVRKPGRVSKEHLRTVRDKRERKKLQNVEAARRYRDKKKEEQNKIDKEEAALISKNDALKAQLQDIQDEMKTMKKLMVELGLLKVVTKWG